MRRIKEASQYFKIFLQLHTPNSITRSIPNPFMDDDGAVVIPIFPHQKVWSSNPRNTKFYFVFLKLKLIKTQTHDIYYLYYYRVVAIHILSNCISTIANHILNEADTSWSAGCWRMTSQ